MHNFVSTEGNELIFKKIFLLAGKLRGCLFLVKHCFYFQRAFIKRKPKGMAVQASVSKIHLITLPKA
jgi:hypothetical protein